MRTLTATAALLLFASSADAEVNCRLNRPPECAKPFARCTVTAVPLIPDLREAMETGAMRCEWKVHTESEWKTLTTPPPGKRPSPGIGDRAFGEGCIHERPMECVTAMCGVHRGPNDECVWERVH